MLNSTLAAIPRTGLLRRSGSSRVCDTFATGLARRLSSSSSSSSNNTAKGISSPPSFLRVIPSFKCSISHWSEFSSGAESLSFNRRFTSNLPSSNQADWSVFYRIEANNASRKDATQLTVSGPDIDGILASMTVALAVKGCSLVELHAAKSIDMASFHKFRQGGEEDVPMIHDVFYVVERSTGRPFSDDDLEPLAKSLLDSLKTPMNIVGVGTAPNVDFAKYQDAFPPPSNDVEQIKIVKSTDGV